MKYVTSKGYSFSDASIHTTNELLFNTIKFPSDYGEPEGYFGDTVDELKEHIDKNKVSSLDTLIFEDEYPFLASDGFYYKLFLPIEAVTMFKENKND